MKNKYCLGVIALLLIVIVGLLITRGQGPTPDMTPTPTGLPLEVEEIPVADGLALLYESEGGIVAEHIPIDHFVVYNDITSFANDFNNIQAGNITGLDGSESIALALIGEESFVMLYDPQIINPLPGDNTAVEWYEYALTSQADGNLASGFSVSASHVFTQPITSQTLTVQPYDNLGDHLVELVDSIDPSEKYWRLLLVKTVGNGQITTLLILNNEDGSPAPGDRLRRWCTGPPPRVNFACSRLLQ